jgi:predicted Zn-dependent protease with MMP-like domain
MPLRTDWRNTPSPSLGDIEVIAAEAYETIPEVLRSRVDAVVIRVEQFPDDETLADLGMQSPFELLGLYRGVSLDQKSVLDSSQDVDMIFLYRRPLLDYWCETGEEMGTLIRHVLIHEIGHHFGYSDDDMEAIEALAG